MRADLATRGYTVDDLDWLRDEIGVAHLELDPWGSLIVSPATDEHELAMTLLHEQALRQLDLPPGSVRSNGFHWVVAGGAGYEMTPDLTVLAPGWQRVGELGIDPPPLLVVEIASPSTRRVDRTGSWPTTGWAAPASTCWSTCRRRSRPTTSSSALWSPPPAPST